MKMKQSYKYISAEILEPDKGLPYLHKVTILENMIEELLNGEMDKQLYRYENCL